MAENRKWRWGKRHRNLYRGPRQRRQGQRRQRTEKGDGGRDIRTYRRQKTERGNWGRDQQRAKQRHRVNRQRENVTA